MPELGGAGRAYRVLTPRRTLDSGLERGCALRSADVDPVTRTLRIGPTSITTDDSSRRRLRVGDKAGRRRSPRTAGTRTLSRATSRSERSSARHGRTLLGLTSAPSKEIG